MRRVGVLVCVASLWACNPESINVKNTPPEVTITAPGAGQEIHVSQTVVFEAAAVDQQSPTTELTFLWTSDVDGALPGEQIVTEDTLHLTVTSSLTPGPHVVTLLAVDSDGATGTSEVEFSILGNEAPLVTFLAPEEGQEFAEGVAVEVLAQVDDVDQEEMNDVTLSWEGLPEGMIEAPEHPDSAGQVSMLLTDLEVGTYILTLTAEDNYGATAAASLFFDVATGDGDGDGFFSLAMGGDDCDDDNAEIHPEAFEVCDDVDNDCDEEVDEEDAVDAPSWYTDSDGDGFGDPETAVVNCEPAADTVSDATDCDDTNGDIHPSASELCDSIDNNCDDDIDGADAVDAPTWYADEDDDGYGDASLAQVMCSVPLGYVADNTDCKDEDPTTHPMASQLCDGLENDCDSAAWPIVPSDETDDDGDGFVECEGWVGDSTAGVSDGGDCDDSQAGDNPAADEVCDGADNDCDDEIDEDAAVDVATWYADADEDGYGDEDVADIDCEQPDGYVADDQDCDDTDGEVHPLTDELCDSVDNDCDGEVDEDEAVDVKTWYIDGDADGYGDSGSTDVDCDQPDGFDDDELDCDDADAATYPGAAQVCDGVANDCDSGSYPVVPSDETDDDGDGYVECESWVGTIIAVDGGGDCDDVSAANFPGADEVCDGEDDDCDGAVDEDDAVDVLTWYADTDEDTYGDADNTDIDCEQPTGYVADDTDCDDAQAAISPAADEVCDDADNDCDEDIDEDSAVDAPTWYLDGDGDAFGDVDTTTVSCLAPTDYVADDRDCDDGRADINPEAAEVCDDLDNDCDGTVDNDDATDALTWYRDADGDDYGDVSTTTSACSEPASYVADATDCNDGNNTIHPGASEICDDDNVDENCNGTADDEDSTLDPTSTADWYPDADGDGYGAVDSALEACEHPGGHVANDQDCDDADAAVNPDTVWFFDWDYDGYGDEVYYDSQTQCVSPGDRWVRLGGDCLAYDDTVYPGAPEICFTGSSAEGKDNDCDDAVDEDCPVGHCGTISADETWEKNAYGHQVTCPVTVIGSDAPTLTIEDGAVVSFAEGSTLKIGTTYSPGNLVIEAADEGVVFTSGASEPEPGDWYGLFIQSSLGTSVDGLTIEYAGKSASNQGALHVANADPVLKNLTIEHAQYEGMTLYSASPVMTDSRIAHSGRDGLACTYDCLSSADGAFSGNTFTENGRYPVRMYAVDAHKLNPANSYSGNTEDVIALWGDYLEGDVTWQALDVPYLAMHDVTVNNWSTPPSLTLADGVEIYFEYNALLKVDSGTLVIDGHTDGVLLSSAQDSPQAGDWYGLLVGYSADVDSVIHGLTVEYAGSSGGYGARFNIEEGISITNSTFRYNAGNGVEVMGSAEVAFSDNVVMNNDESGVYIEVGGELTSPFTNNVLSGNGDYPISLSSELLRFLDKSSSYSGNGEAYVKVTRDSHVAESGTWQVLDVPYAVIGDIDIVDYTIAPLITIEDGAEFYFGDGYEFRVGSYGGGDLRVEGDRAGGSGVVFASLSGGGAGTWEGLQLGNYTSAATHLSGFEVRDGGANNRAGVFVAYAENVTLQDCLVEHNAHYGVRVVQSVLSMTNCEVSNTKTFTATSDIDGAGVYVDVNSVLLDWADNTVTSNESYPVLLPPSQMIVLEADGSSYTGNPDSGGAKDFVYVFTNSSGLGTLIEVDGTIATLDVPWLVGSDIKIEGGALFPPTVEVADATLYFLPGNRFYVGYGGEGDLIADNVIFTSALDPAYAGDWDGLYFGTNSSSRSSVTNSTVQYAGLASGWSYGAVYLAGAAATLEGNTIENSASYGIRCSSYVGPSDLAGANMFSAMGMGDTYGCD